MERIIFMGIFGMEPFCLDWGMMDRAFDSVINAKTAYPVDMLKVTDKDKVWYEIRVALAGLSKEDISLAIDKNVLTVTVDPCVIDRDPDKSYPEYEYIRKGIKTSKMELKYTLGSGIDTEKIKDPVFENGILTIKLPTVEVKKAKKLTIK